MPSRVEAGVRRNETYFIREVEDSRGRPVAPQDPTIKLYSSVVESLEAEPSAGYSERIPIGGYMGVDKNRSQEEHEVTVGYDLERFPVDTSGNAVDAVADGALRNIDYQIGATHSVLQIEQRAELVVANTAHRKYFEEQGNSHPSGSTPAATARASRTEFYSRGSIPEEVALTLDPSDSPVASAELSYTARKTRRYQFDQPNTEYLHLRAVLEDGSSNSADAGATVEVESVDGSQSETVTLDSSDASTAVSTSSTFDSVRVNLPEDLEGVLEVYADDGSGTDAPGAPGQLLSWINGAEQHEGIEGDQGVPLVGSGSFEDESVLSDAIPASRKGSTTWQGSPYAETVMDMTLTVSNEIEDNVTGEGLSRDLRGSTQEVTVECTVFGETESVDKFGDHITGREGEFRIPLVGGDIVMPRAYCSEGGSVEKETEQAVLQVEVTMKALMPEDGSDPLQFVAA